MKAISEKEALLWLDNHGLNTRSYVSANDFFSDIPFQDFAIGRYSLPEQPGRRIALARGLFSQLKPACESLVWLRNWMVWPSSGHIPLALRLRQGMGSDDSLEEAPCQIFTSAEIDDAVSFFIISLVFSWDCFVFDAEQRLMWFLSHDDYLILMGANRAALAKIGNMLESAKWCRPLSKQDGFK